MKSADFDIPTQPAIVASEVFSSPKSLNISSIREKFGLDQSEFADVLGISKHHLKVWEEGAAEPPRPVMLLLRVADRWPVAFIDSLIDY